MRILAGDFNMSLWVVAREMRRLGLQISLAAAYAWNNALTKAVKPDSCGILIIGPMASTKLLWGPSVFQSENTDPASIDTLPSFIKGQGYHLGSYLLRKGVRCTRWRRPSSVRWKTARRRTRRAGSFFLRPAQICKVC